MFRRLEQEIVDGNVAEGTRLGTKADLRERFGVAVATINEAVRMLEIRGLIEARPGPGGGLFVKELSALVRLQHVTLHVSGPRADRVREALVVRSALEHLVCSEAGRHSTAEDLRAYEECLARMEAAETPREHLQANWDLHRAIVMASPNQLLREMYLGLLAVAEEALEDVEPEQDRRQRNRDHRRLVAAIASGDPSAITKAVAKHDPMRSVA